MVPFGEFVTLKLAESYMGCGKNLTTENFFTSMSLATKFFTKKKTMLIGTLRGNKRELPKLARQRKDNMNRFSTTLYRSNNCTLTIYKPKLNKKILS